jgi:hypothetical protein
MKRGFPSLNQYTGRAYTEQNGNMSFEIKGAKDSYSTTLTATQISTAYEDVERKKQLLSRVDVFVHGQTL